MTEGQKHRETMAMREKEAKMKLAGDVIKAGATVLKGAGKTAAKSIAPKTKYILNDPAWYTKWLPDYKPFTNLTTIRRLGVGDSNVCYEQQASGVGTYVNVPGVMSINFISHLGMAKPLTGGAGVSEKFPINVSIARNYALIRKANGRAVSYSPDVLGFYWVGVTELATLLEDLRVTLSIADQYSAENSYLPRVLIAARGWSPDAIINYRALLKDIYLNFAARFNSNLVIPKDYSLLNRRTWLVRTHVKDMDLNRGQVYVFKQIYFGFIDNDDQHINYADIRAVLANGVSAIDTFRSTLEGYFSQLENSISFVQLVADIRSAMQSSEFYQASLTFDDALKEIPATHEVLSQIHNLRTLPFTPTTAQMQVSSTGDYLQQYELDEQIQYSSATRRDAILGIITKRAADVILDAYSNEVSGDDLLVMTRFVPVFSAAAVGTDSLKLSVYGIGTEVACSITMYWDYNDLSHHNTVRSDSYFSYSTADFQNYALITKFDWHPLLTVADQNSTLPDFLHFTIGEIGNYFKISNINMIEIHRQCVLSEYFVGSDQFNLAFGK